MYNAGEMIFFLFCSILNCKMRNESGDYNYAAFI